MPADKRLIECPSCYATKGQYHKPGCPALTPPAGPATACLCGSPYADWTANGKLMCARCAANFVAASRFSADPAAVPPPEWAVKMVASVGEDYAEELERLRGRGEPYLIGSNGLWYQMLARLLASVREGAIHRASEVAYDVAEENPKDVRNAILALLDTPPSGGGGA